MDKQLCSDCNKEFTLKTLNKYGGICGKCNIKNISSKNNCKICNISFNVNILNKYNGLCNKCYNKNLPKDTCSNCESTYTKLTLKKYGGICGKCFKKIDQTPQSLIQTPLFIKNINKISQSQSNYNCPKCNLTFTLKTLKRYNGICGKCFKINMLQINNELLNDDLLNFIHDRFNKCHHILSNIKYDTVLNIMTYSLIISKLFPPKYNQNKFIYSKLIELKISHLLSTDLSCKLLTNNYYTNDIILNIDSDLHFFVKTTKSLSNVFLIDKKNNLSYRDMFLIIFNIKLSRIFVFNTSLLPDNMFKDKDSFIELDRLFYNYLMSSYPKLIINIDIDNEILEKINNIEIFDYNQLFLNKVDTIFTSINS